jgi:MFS family permease
LNTIISSSPYLFGRIYGYNDLQIGLSYIPYGIASFLAPLMNGILLDWNFRRVARHAGIIIEGGHTQDIDEFPLELARFPVALPMGIAGAILLISYGWALELEAHLAVLLVLQFFIGLTIAGCFQVINVVIVDYR